MPTTTSAEGTLEISYGRLVTWLLGILTTVIMALGTCVATEMKGDISDLQKIQKETNMEVTKGVVADAVLTEKLVQIAKVQNEILVEVKLLRQEAGRGRWADSE